MTESLNSSCAMCGGRQGRCGEGRESEIVADQSCWLFLPAKFGDLLLYAPAIFLPIYFLAPSFSSKIRSYPGQLEFMVCLGAELYFNSNSNRVGSALPSFGWLLCSSSGRLFPQHPGNCLQNQVLVQLVCPVAEKEFKNFPKSVRKSSRYWPMTEERLHRNEYVRF